MDPMLIAIIVLVVIANGAPQTLHCLADQLGIGSTLGEASQSAVAVFVMAAILTGFVVGVPIGYAISH